MSTMTSIAYPYAHPFWGGRLFQASAHQAGGPARRPDALGHRIRQTSATQLASGRSTELSLEPLRSTLSNQTVAENGRVAGTPHVS